MDAQTEPVSVIPAETTVFDFEAVFHAQYARIARVITRIVKDSARAEELSVEVFWKLLHTAGAHGPGANGWLYTTAVRMALDELRKQCRREKYERLFSLSRRASSENWQSVADKQDRVRDTLAGLDRRSAEMLILRSEGFSYQDIAQALDLNPVSVGTLLGRAQQAFRKEYIKRYGKP
jgi:RNA polymerase sigma-70 factor (ECF subfamily)